MNEHNQTSHITHSCLQLHFLGPFINESIDLLCTSSVGMKLSFVSSVCAYNKSCVVWGLQLPYNNTGDDEQRDASRLSLPPARRRWAALYYTDHQLVKYCWIVRGTPTSEITRAIFHHQISSYNYTFVHNPQYLSYSFMRSQSCIWAECSSQFQ